ncbi:MAG: 5-deoxy-glucuronate isomerase, partial [Clostridia bacterium]|nr:5-deoxy-glucuronate isomerase [Clostridia bacterium]
MRLKQKEPFHAGYNSITELSGKHSEMLMDFGILKLEKGKTFADPTNLEKVAILLSGEIEVSYNSKKVKVQRDNCFDDNLWCLNTDENTPYEILGIAENSE